MPESLTKPAGSASTYDEIPYPSHPYEATHPDNLYSMGRLFRLDPKLPDESSILELGCASGGNIIPLAVQMPKARCVGIDASQRQIGEGQQTIETLGLKNLQLRALDFRELDDSFGKFDYIICHGVFSWVPPLVQNRILEICRHALAEKGIAFISYNAYPGWFMRGMIRQMMLHHVKHIVDPTERIRQARALLSFLVESTEEQTTPYAMNLKQELEMLSKHSDAYLFHDHLEENNHPLFFYEFMELATAQELQFVGETNLASMVTSNLPAKAAEALTKLTDNLHHRSQYTDFVTNRMFRQSLFCHTGVRVNRHLDESSLVGLRFSGTFQVQTADENTTGKPIAGSTKEVTFQAANGRIIKTCNAAIIALLNHLGQAAPASLDLQEITSAVERSVTGIVTANKQNEDERAQLCRNFLLQLLARGDVQFRALPDRFTDRVSDRPEVSALSRLQAKSDASITTQRHSMFNADRFTKLIVQALDGRRSRSDLANYVGELIASGALTIDVGSGTHVDMERIRQAVVDNVLEQLRSSALLVA